METISWTRIMARKRLSFYANVSSAWNHSTARDAPRPVNSRTSPAIRLGRGQHNDQWRPAWCSTSLPFICLPHLLYSSTVFYIAQYFHFITKRIKTGLPGNADLILPASNSDGLIELAVLKRFRRFEPFPECWVVSGSKTVWTPWAARDPLHFSVFVGAVRKWPRHDYLRKFFTSIFSHLRSPVTDAGNLSSPSSSLPLSISDYHLFNSPFFVIPRDEERISLFHGHWLHFHGDCNEQYAQAYHTTSS